MYPWMVLVPEGYFWIFLELALSSFMTTKSNNTNDINERYRVQNEHIRHAISEANGVLPAMRNLAASYAQDHALTGPVVEVDAAQLLGDFAADTRDKITDVLLWVMAERPKLDLTAQQFEHLLAAPESTSEPPWPAVLLPVPVELGYSISVVLIGAHSQVWAHPGAPRERVEDELGDILAVYTAFCGLLTSPDRLQKVVLSKSARKKARREGKPSPKVSTYRWNHTVTHDLRSYVARAERGSHRGSPHRYQSPVRGFYRWQPIGPRYQHPKLHKQVWVKPFVKGKDKPRRPGPVTHRARMDCDEAQAS